MRFIKTTGDPALDREIDALWALQEQQASAGQVNAIPVTPSPSPAPVGVRTLFTTFQVAGDVTFTASGLLTITQTGNNFAFAVSSSTLPPHPTRSVTAATNTATTADETVELDTTANAVTLKLPALPSALKFLAVKWTAGVNTATVDGNGANIDGSATYVFAVAKDSIDIRQSADGSQWFIYD